MNTRIPNLSQEDIESHFIEAEKTSRRRSPLILHKKGDYLNKVFNFIGTPLEILKISKP